MTHHRKERLPLTYGTAVALHSSAYPPRNPPTLSYFKGKYTHTVWRLERCDSCFTLSVKS